MAESTIHYELKGRMSLDGGWTVIGYAATKDLLDVMIERNTKMWKYLTWNGYRAAQSKSLK